MRNYIKGLERLRTTSLELLGWPPSTQSESAFHGAVVDELLAKQMFLPQCPWKRERPLGGSSGEAEHETEARGCLLRLPGQVLTLC